jgi:hypothetical protein
VRRVGKHFASSPAITPSEWEQNRLPGETAKYTVYIHALICRIVKTESDPQSTFSMLEFKPSGIPSKDLSPRSVYKRSTKYINEPD